MNNREFHRLIAFQTAKRNKPSAPLNALGRRFAKGAGKGFGFVGKYSRIIPQVGINRYFGNSFKHHNG